MKIFEKIYLGCLLVASFITLGAMSIIPGGLGVAFSIFGGLVIFLISFICGHDSKK